MRQPEVHDVLDLPRKLGRMLCIISSIPATNAREHWFNVSRLIAEQTYDDFVSSNFAKSVQKAAKSLRQRYYRPSGLRSLYICIGMFHDEGQKTIDDVLDKRSKHGI